jgi:hypothetical protein
MLARTRASDKRGSMSEDCRLEMQNEQEAGGMLVSATPLFTCFGLQLSIHLLSFGPGLGRVQLTHGTRPVPGARAVNETCIPIFRACGQGKALTPMTCAIPIYQGVVLEGGIPINWKYTMAYPVRKLPCTSVASCFGIRGAHGHVFDFLVCSTRHR